DLPFRGGLAGLLGFELLQWIDPPRVPLKCPRTPSMWVGVFPAAAIFTHATSTWTLVGPADHPARRLLAVGLEESTVPAAAHTPRADRAAGRPRWVEQGVGSGVDPEAVYPERVRACRDAIYAGELFEVNYAERFDAAWPHSGFSLYEAMRRVATGDYFAYLDAGDFQVASVSPEQFLEVRDGVLRARPIKGSCPRHPDPEVDRDLATGLLASEKDRAENVMIVDLMRNDLTRVCRVGSVVADEICSLESFAGIHHLVSTVTGRLEDGIRPLDALLSCFPAGSITGAPKLRSVEIIAEVEGSARGAYTGSMFYASAHGALDASVLIRTAELVDGQARYGAGGAVVAQSDPVSEWREALLKRALFDRALSGGTGREP
ncbi:MAG: anthranilate synthase component I family protein, partial [Myxococcota bacterium]